MPTTTPQISEIRRSLRRVGYVDNWLRSDVAVGATGNITVPLVAFSGEPFDARTACVSALQGNCENAELVASVRDLAAPIAIVAGTTAYEVWKHEADNTAPRRLDRLAPTQLTNFFEHNRSELAPKAVYRAKVWGRLEQGQRDFVDAGLLPLLEEEIGERLTNLIVRTVYQATADLGWSKPTSDQGKWLLKSIFWLLAAKILQDKRVPGFVRLDIEDLDEVFPRIARHYNSTDTRIERLGRERRSALEGAAKEIKSFAHLGLLSTEALGYVYESALIDKVTRQKLGTHSTPPWLVDYAMGKLRPWVEAMAVDERRVFEPACGHGAFLIAALRLLSELRPPSSSEDRRIYLRKRLRGVEIDEFAIEIARLSLTLADVPNPNGWALLNEDMFASGRLAPEAAAATIVLSNPPFGAFSSVDKPHDWQFNKAAETVRLVLDNLPNDSVFGIIVPHNFLVSKNALPVRKRLLIDCEIAEICVFADKVFRYGEPESALLLGRKLSPKGRSTILYQRIRENQIDVFKHDYTPSSSSLYAQADLLTQNKGSLFVAELAGVWDAIAHHPRLEDFAIVGKGFEHKHPGHLGQGVVREADKKTKGLIPGFARWNSGLLTHQLPAIIWLNLDQATISRPRSGTTRHVPQVLTNYAPVSRDQWCLNALIDAEGHPLTTRFNVVRPKHSNLSLQTLWAILNSPLGNAFAHTHSTKRDILTGTLNRLPIPDPTTHDFTVLDRAVVTYFTHATSVSLASVQTVVPAQGDLFKKGEDQVSKSAAPGVGDRLSAEVSPLERLKVLHWRIDAEVLRLYQLPPDLERQVLTYFTDAERHGVAFPQKHYFPKAFEELNTLAELLAVTVDWDTHDARKAELIEKKVERRASIDDLRELKELKRLTSARRELLTPLPLPALEKIKMDLLRRGIWRED